MENVQAEPSMEEILASIRRIISEDDTSESKPSPAASAPSAAASAAPAPRPPAADKPSPKSRASLDAEPAEAEIETDREADEPDAPPAAVDNDVPELHLETEDIEMISKSAAAKIDDDDQAILADTAAAAASQAFDSLSQSVKVSAGEGRTLEAIVIEMLRPMVKQWLDANLPAIVEEKVEEEVRRLARRRG